MFLETVHLGSLHSPTTDPARQPLSTGDDHPDKRLLSKNDQAQKVGQNTNDDDQTKPTQGTQRHLHKSRAASGEPRQ